MSRSIKSWQRKVTTWALCHNDRGKREQLLLSPNCKDWRNSRSLSRSELSNWIETLVCSSRRSVTWMQASSRYAITSRGDTTARSKRLKMDVEIAVTFRYSHKMRQKHRWLAMALHWARYLQCLILAIIGIRKKMCSKDWLGHMSTNASIITSLKTISILPNILTW